MLWGKTKKSSATNRRVSGHKRFYGVYMMEIIPAAILTVIFTNLINLALDVMVFSAIALALPLLIVIRIGSNREIMGQHKIGAAH